MEEPMVLVLLLAEVFMSMIYHFKQVGTARGVGAEARQRAGSREQTFMPFLPLHAGKSGQH